MQQLATGGGVRARFHESRQISFLTEPIESSGMLYFAPPDRLARHTTQPSWASIVVDAGHVSIEDGTGRRTFDMNTSKVAHTLVTNLIVVLRGDLQSLAARYLIGFHQEQQSWTLDLEPRSSALRGMIERVRFTGHGPELTAMETLETNGDRTILTFSDVETGVTWNPSAMEHGSSIDASDTTQ